MTSRPVPVEALLADLADHIDWPGPSDLIPNLSPRLANPPVRRDPRRWITVTAALVIMVASLLLFSPQARQAVADFLGVAGIEIEFEPELEEPIGEGLGLGRAVVLEEAAETVDFNISVPTALDEPESVYLIDGRVNLVWEGRETLPAAGDTGVGLLYSQFRSDTSGDGFIKGLGPDTVVVPIEAAGSTGFWIEGAPHVITYEDGTGRRVEESTRLAGNVLMWEAAGVTHRIETVLGLEETLRIAESVEPFAN